MEEQPRVRGSRLQVEARDFREARHTTYDVLSTPDSEPGTLDSKLMFCLVRLSRSVGVSRVKKGGYSGDQETTFENFNLGQILRTVFKSERPC